MTGPSWHGEGSMEESQRLRAQMRADSLKSLDDGEDLPRDAGSGNDPWEPETIDEIAQFLRLNVSPLVLVPVTSNRSPNRSLFLSSRSLTDDISNKSL
jgi:hypothetical protein